MATTPALTIAERVGALVRIPSVNPLQAGPRSGSDGERAISSWLADQADALGADVTVDEVVDGRCNVYARFAGTTDRSVTIDVHLDTVGVEHMTDDPFDGRIEDDRVYGRGSVDTKATLAIVMSVLDELRTEGRTPLPTVNLVGTISEEMGGLIGASRYRDWLSEQGARINQLVVAEPTLCAPVHGHMGGVGLEISVHGHAAHSSKPHLGKNAISAAARIVLAIDHEQQRISALAPTTSVGNGAVSVTEISGGLARNIIPDGCVLYAGRRTAPGEDPMAIFEQLSAIVRRAAAPLDVSIELANGMASAAFYQDPQSPIVQTLVRHSGCQPDVASYGSNALRYGEIADEIVLFGPGSIDQAHQAVEWVAIEQLAKAADIYRALLSNAS
ncbi:MAG: M20/M25/M40 family metallo-hydrolase [Actinomycetota bacterium]|nr:M20/M25/M40 family metallo-hydrolase [Actinomycetota bacterium]